MCLALSERQSHYAWTARYCRSKVNLINKYSNPTRAPEFQTVIRNRAKLLKYCCFYHVRGSITYDEKHILSFYFIWPQQIHCIIDNSSNGGNHSFQHFTRQQEYFSRLFMFKDAHNMLPIYHLRHWFNLWRPVFVFSDTISYFVHCIRVARSKIVLSQHGFGGNGMSCVFFQELSKTGGLYFI